MYRPPSVWLTQVLLVGILLQFALFVPVFLFSCFSLTETTSCLAPDRITALAGLLLNLAVVFVTFWGLLKRKRYGQWLAAILLAAAAVAAIAKGHSMQLIYQSITQWRPLPTPPYECWQPDPMMTNSQTSCGYETYGGLTLNIFTDVGPALILGWLAVRLLTSNASRRFFRSARQDP